MKVSRVVGTLSEILQVFIQDSSSTTGAGLTSLVSTSSGFSAFYCRNDGSAATTITLVTMTAGSFSSGGFVAIDNVNMPGWYQFCPPNAAFSSGRSSAIHLKGATNQAPLPIEIELTQVNNQDSAGFGMSRVDTSISSRSTQASLDVVDDFLDTEMAALTSNVGVILGQTGTTGVLLTSAYNFAKGTSAMSESYAANTVTPTPIQALFAIQQILTMFAISGTSLTVKKLDGSAAFVVTLDDGTNPTAATRA